MSGTPLTVPGSPRAEEEGDKPLADAIRANREGAHHVLVDLENLVYQLGALKRRLRMHGHSPPIERIIEMHLMRMRNIWNQITHLSGERREFPNPPPLPLFWS